IASVYTTFLMLIVVGAHVLYATGDTLLQKLRSRRGHFRFQSVRWSAHTISVGLALLVVSPILLSLIRNYATAMEMLKWLQQHMTPLLRLRFWSFSPLFNWAFYPTFQFPLPGGMDNWLLQLTTILVVQLVAWVYLFRREKSVASYLLLLCLGFAAAFWLPDLLDGGRRATVVRYFLPLTMIMTLPMGYFLYHLWQSHGAKRFFAACLVAFLFGCQIQSDSVVAECPERARWECDIKPIAACLAKDPDALIITDHKTVSLAQVIAIGRVLDEPNRKFAWLYFAEIPDWMKKVDHAFVLHARWHVVNRFRRNGFEVRWVDRERGLLWVRPLAKPANGPS
ncbi:MAG: hypothetical protein K2X93_24005, partial [Candidatus Obscuribacterales bacterium]|nr:hypothetical protein [Candidatus Obscuribacterales bacterium]